MRECLTSLVKEHDGTIVPAAVVSQFETQGSAALTMRYGSPTVHDHGEKARAKYTLTARRVTPVDEDDPLYATRVETPQDTVRAFLFHTSGTRFQCRDDLDAAFTAFALDLVEEMNTSDMKWYVAPHLRPLCEAFAEYPHDFDSTTQSRSITLRAPATGDEFVRPSNLSVSDLRFVSVRRTVSEGEILLETDARPEDVLDDIWLEKASAGVGDDVTLDVRERNDGGTAFVVAESNE